MKFTLSWLKDHLDTTASLEDIVQKLTAIGLEVEDVKDPAKDFAGFVVGHVEQCEKHPDADKLRCLIVNTGTEKLKVVCGAPNARLGLKGIFAPAGSYIPGSNITLKKSLIRGQESNGMMCSERELCLSTEHEGIIELPESAVIGSPAADALGINDPVIEINLTPNRGDCAGILGIARDLAAAGLGKIKNIRTERFAGNYPSPIRVSIADEQACPLFIGCYFKGVKNGASPAWLQQRLKAIGLRPISALVDITNYLTIDYNRPAHIFDADKIKGNIHVRLSKKGETFAALNDKSYELDDGMTVICDDSGVLGLGGIIGGTSTSVTAETTNAYLEIAYFDPVRIAKTGQKLMIDSDARYRFERGIDPAFCVVGADVATQLIQEICGGDTSEYVTAGAAPDLRKTISYSPARLKLLGGHDLPEARQKEILAPLGFSVESKEDVWTITTPTWRHDLEGSADIVEEILRIDGYDNIPRQAVKKETTEQRSALSPLQKRIYAVRRILAGRGMLETVTWSFLADSTADLFGANDRQNKKALTLQNPISADLAVMRPSILPNLVEAAGRNADKGYPDACLFEMGNVYHATDAKGQLATASGLRAGNAAPRHWAQAARHADVFDAKADAFAVLETCGLNPAGVQITTDAPTWYHPGRSGTLRLGTNIIAYFGELHPSVLAEMKREENYVGFEVFLSNIPATRNKSSRKELLKPSPFQPVSRDFAFIVDQKIEADKLVRAVKAVDKNLIASVDIFDVYAGKGVAEGKKSLGIAVTLQPIDKTLTDEEIQALCLKITANVEKQTGGVLRS